MAYPRGSRYPPIHADDVSEGRFGLARLEWGLDKLPKGAGPGVNPTEIDVSVVVPSGLIAVWHGLIANIPSGWVICDGLNLTPNLLAKFVQGVATATTDPGATGGATSKTTGGHTHTNPATGAEATHTHSNPAMGSSGAHTHTVDLHRHTIDRALLAASGTATATAASSLTTAEAPLTDSQGAHTHTLGSTGAGSSHSHSQGSTGSGTDSISDIRPLYYDVAFIMKT